MNNVEAVNAGLKQMDREDIEKIKAFLYLGSGDDMRLENINGFEIFDTQIFGESVVDLVSFECVNRILYIPLFKDSSTVKSIKKYLIGYDDCELF